MESHHKIILRMELQIGQLIRLVANLNERLDVLEQKAKDKEIRKVLQMNRISRI
ncbi:hypothetical protein [Sporosarcina gallistercoris]|uniref:hypothetical protein n=1 Tax=Sporosarcina gallistercoris TaxID=2762245 RepID=UPI0017840B4A|nr:hypothetical protein [Sporosarcina gallistercoris]